jgi:hypothetical protein
VIILDNRNKVNQICKALYLIAFPKLILFYTLIEKVAFFNHYSNFGSGLDEIKGNKKTEVKLQSIFSF